MISYFKDSEVKGLNKSLVTRLNIARHEAGIPFIITSGLRSEEKNKQVAGVGDSAHLKGLAVDILCKTSNQRFLIIKGAIEAGFQRIGIYKNHVHLDIDMSKPYKIIFMG